MQVFKPPASTMQAFVKKRWRGEALIELSTCFSSQGNLVFGATLWFIPRGIPAHHWIASSTNRKSSKAPPALFYVCSSENESHIVFPKCATTKTILKALTETRSTE
jgi:hypothetical protein